MDDLAEAGRPTAVVVHPGRVDDEVAHYDHKEHSEMVVVADHTVAAEECMLEERSWGDSSEQTKEQVEVHAAWEPVGVVVEADHAAERDVAASVDRSAIDHLHTQLWEGHVVDSEDPVGQELEVLYRELGSADCWGRYNQLVDLDVGLVGCNQHWVVQDCMAHCESRLDRAGRHLYHLEEDRHLVELAGIVELVAAHIHKKAVDDLGEEGQEVEEERSCIVQPSYQHLHVCWDQEGQVDVQDIGGGSQGQVRF
jgi:hypothetical protein